jgi:hypothetical protein
MDQEAQARAALLARWLASAGRPPEAELRQFCTEQLVVEAFVELAKGERTFLCGPATQEHPRSVEGRVAYGDSSFIVVRLQMPVNFGEKQKEIQREVLQAAQGFPQSLPAAVVPDHPVHPVCGDLGRAVYGAADQRPDSGDIGSCRRGAQREPGVPHSNTGDG